MSLMIGLWLIQFVTILADKFQIYFMSNIQFLLFHLFPSIFYFQIYDEDEQTFVVEVFSGCVRYEEVMNVVMNGYYAKDGKTVLRSEQNLYGGMFFIILLI